MKTITTLSIALIVMTVILFGCTKSDYITEYNSSQSLQEFAVILNPIQFDTLTYLIKYRVVATNVKDTLYFNSFKDVVLPNDSYRVFAYSIPSVTTWDNISNINYRSTWMSDTVNVYANKNNTLLLTLNSTAKLFTTHAQNSDQTLIRTATYTDCVGVEHELQMKLSSVDRVETVVLPYSINRDGTINYSGKTVRIDTWYNRFAYVPICK